MFLRRIYSEPAGLFQEVKFKDGMNIIFGYKDPDVSSDLSLNGIGKSTFLDLIDFCLLASYGKSASNRLYLARDIMKGYSILLEFEVDGEIYTLKRSTDDPSVIFFGTDKSNLPEYSIKKLKPMLCDLIFQSSDYKGKYNSAWLRYLLLFFLKIHRHRRADKFIDPIQYIDKARAPELLQYHLFLLGIDNSLAYKNNQVQIDKKSKTPALAEVKRLVEESYGIEDIDEANNLVHELEREVRQLEKSLEKFRLSENYEDSEKKANELTASIKTLWVKNVADRKRIEEYRKSYLLDDTFTQKDLSRVKRIYKQVNDELSLAISKTLEQAIDFRRQLAASRKDFIQTELNKLSSDIKTREGEIKSLDNDRAAIFDFLKTKEAIKDLTEAFNSLNEKKNQLTDLQAKLGTYNTLQIEKLEIDKEEKVLEIEIKGFISDIQSGIVAELHDLFMDIYSAIYRKSKEASFTIADKLSTDAKFEILVKVPNTHSKAKNQGRTLVYDLMVLLNMINKQIRGPRFLAHDGIFDGMDRAHFVRLYDFVQSQNEMHRFQYIVTLNEEGELNEAFGDKGKVTTEKILDEAILVLTAGHKLFNKDFA